MTQSEPKLEQGQLPNTCQYTASTPRSDYLIQIAWPQCWTKDRVAPENDPPVSILYLVDGNAYFFTAVDVTRRLESTDNARTIVVGIGYTPNNYVYHHQRSPDFTPPTPDGQYEMPLGGDGKPRTDLRYGEADKFLEFIEQTIMPFVETTLFGHMSLSSGRKAFYGHSYGGLFALNVLFTRPTLFNFIIAASPTTWWNNYSVSKYQEPQLLKLDPPASPRPTLLMAWGTMACELEKRSQESDEAFRRRKAAAEGDEMNDGALALLARLEKCPSIESTSAHVFPGEDHASVAVVSLQRGIMRFLLGDS